MLDGDNLHFDDGPHTSIATGSLQNKIFPPSKEIQTSLRLALRTWTTRHSLPSLQKPHIDELWHRSIQSHYHTLNNHITHKDISRFKRLFPEAVFHNEDKRATSLRIYCPVLYFQCLTTTFADPLVFRKLEQSPSDIIERTIAEINRHFGNSYPWALGAGRDLPNAYVLPKRKKQFKAGRPIVSFFTAPFRPMLNCTAKLIYNLLPQAFPHNLARGDVFDLIKLLKDTDFDSLPTPRIHNQDLAGFFTSIDTDRFIASWRLTLQFLSPLMNTAPDEIISVKATPGNNTGDVVKGRTCRTLNVTRKIFIRDIERIILMSLKMTQFSIGTSVFEQIRGSPMGSPLSPALCMMVVALSEEIWYRTYRTTLSNMDLTARLLRYVETDCACRTPAGTTKFASPISSTQSSTAILSFWKRNRTRSSWAFASSLSLLPFATALHATSTRSWRHSPHHLWPSNFQALFHDYFWSPNVRTPHMNGHEVLPHCIVCTDQPVSPSPISSLLPSRFVNIYTFPYCGKILNCLAADAYVSLLTPC